MKKKTKPTYAELKQELLQTIREGLVQLHIEVGSACGYFQGLMVVGEFKAGQDFANERSSALLFKLVTLQNAMRLSENAFDGKLPVDILAISGDIFMRVIFLQYCSENLLHTDHELVKSLQQASPGSITIVMQSFMTGLYSAVKERWSEIN